MITLALSLALQCASWVGTDYDCQAQWAEDARNATCTTDADCKARFPWVTDAWTGYDTCVAELTSAACGDGGTALDAAFEVCENTMPWAPTAAQYLCAEALVTHRDAGIGFESLATEF